MPMKNKDLLEVPLAELDLDKTLPSPVMYQYYKNLKDRKIIINEQIGSDIVENVMIPLLEMDNDGTGKPIEIILNTIGGSLFDGATLCNIIDNLKTPTTITVMTYAYSMGSIILMSGFSNPNVKKRCYKFSTALLHAGNDYLEGNSSSVKDQFNFYQKFDDLIKNFTLSHSTITPEEYDKMERYEWYMTSDVMLEKGLVDEII
jgi:ATP-dependent Clp protease protease subunit|nr:MAG TPA: Protease subunit of ATP-dependent Clp protease [Caudoviricetes sp.]